MIFCGLDKWFWAMFEPTSTFTFGQFSVARKPIINGGPIRPTGLLFKSQFAIKVWCYFCRLLIIFLAVFTIMWICKKINILLLSNVLFALRTIQILYGMSYFRLSLGFFQYVYIRYKSTIGTYDIDLQMVGEISLEVEEKSGKFVSNFWLLKTGFTVLRCPLKTGFTV